jgi:hypothetical protein
MKTHGKNDTIRMTLNHAENKVFALEMSGCYGERANIAKYFFKTIINDE